MRQRRKYDEKNLQGEVQAIGPDKSIEKRQNNKQPLQMDLNGSKRKMRSGGRQLQDLEPVLQGT